MANWKYEIDIKTILNKGDELEDSDPVPQALKEELAAELRKAPPLFHLARRMEGVRTVAGLNRVLEEVYDLADYKRVWLGL